MFSTGDERTDRQTDKETYAHRNSTHQPSRRGEELYIYSSLFTIHGRSKMIMLEVCS